MKINEINEELLPCPFCGGKVKLVEISVELSNDEELNYLEFTEKYEILSEEDGIYRIKEKENQK